MRFLTADIDGKPHLISYAIRYLDQTLSSRTQYDYRLLEQQAESFLKGNAKFVTYFGPSPYELAGFMIDHDCHLTNPLLIKRDTYKGQLYIDVVGDLENCSKAFSYRFYSESDLNEWLAVIDRFQPETTKPVQ